MNKSSNASFRCTSSPFLLLLLCAGIAALYSRIIPGLVDDWLHNDNYSHGFFIPLISGYMLYHLRDKLRNLPACPVNWGLLLLLLGLAQLVVATTGSEFFLQRTSLIPLLLGLLLFLFGMQWTRLCLVPVCYLLFMVPLPAIIWNKIAFPLQLFSTGLTERTVQLLGIPVLREGNILHLAQTTLEVVDACSGLRSLTTMFALSTALAWFASYSTLKKWILFFMAVPIAISANVTRLMATAVLAEHYGADMAQGFLHEFSGMVTFAAGFLMLLAVHALLSKI